MKRFLVLLALLIATPAYAQDADSLAEKVHAETVRMRSFVRASETQATKILALIDSLRALPPAGGVDTVFVTDTVTVEIPPDTIFVTDTLTVTDTVEVQLPPDTVTIVDTVYVEVEAPPAPTMYVAGWADTIPGATENGLWIAWDPMPADSFRVTGGKQDGSDPFEAVVPGSDTTHIHLLHYDTVTAMRGCVSAFRFDIEGPEACDDFEWAPMVQGGPEPPESPGRPEFTVTAGGIEVTWPEAARATAYTYWYTGHPESEGLTTPTNSVTLDDFLDGGFFCVRALNGSTPGPDYRCNSFTP